MANVELVLVENDAQMSVMVTVNFAWMIFIFMHIKEGQNMIVKDCFIIIFADIHINIVRK